MKKINIRLLIQIIVVVLVFWLGYAHQKFGIEKAASIDAYCPFGAVETFFTLIFKGVFLQRIFWSSVILLIVFLVATLFFGRVFCGYFCPLGAIQEWIRALGRKIGIKKDFEIPEKIDKYLRYLKYVVLAAVIYFSFYLGDLVFRNYDPYNALMHFGNEFEEKIVGYSLLAVVVIISLLTKNLWCRYLCPLGAFFSIFKKIGFFKIKRDESTCISCATCNQNCPAGLEIMTAQEVKDADCVSCGKCVKNCPKSSLTLRIFGKEISKPTFSILVLLLVFLPIAILPYTSIWQTKPQSNIVTKSGEINVADIRGSNTLNYLIEKTGVPFEKFQKELNLPEDIDRSMMLKDIGTKYNLKNKEGALLEAEDFREIVRRELGL